jgi:hypothetical protein
MDYNGDEHSFMDIDRNDVIFADNAFFAVKSLRVNYMTYDVRCDQDFLNVRTHSDVMVKSCETKPGYHPFWYAHMLGIFHTCIMHKGPHSHDHSIRMMEFLWVRWFGIALEHCRPRSMAHRLPQIGFIHATDLSAFGFLNPSLVIRGCHLILAFTYGRTTKFLAATNTAARPIGENDDWAYYYVNM